MSYVGKSTEEYLDCILNLSLYSLVALCKKPCRLGTNEPKG